MFIAGTEYNASCKALEIFVSGCTRACPGCHNKELWNFNKGTHLLDIFSDLLDKLDSLPKGLVERIFIVGGEPLQQPDVELKFLLSVLHTFPFELWLFTGYPSFIARSLLYAKDIGSYIHVLKHGRYMADRPSYVDSSCGVNITLASSNQELQRLNPYYTPL